VAPDRRLVDQHQVELAQQLCGAAIEYVEQELGLPAPADEPVAVRQHRLQHLLDRLGQLEAVIGALAADNPPSPLD
jgi:hypothetical protein